MKYLSVICVLLLTSCQQNQDRIVTVRNKNTHPASIKHLPDNVTFQEYKTEFLTCGIVTSKKMNEALSISCVRAE